MEFYGYTVLDRVFSRYSLRWGFQEIESEKEFLGDKVLDKV